MLLQGAAVKIKPLLQACSEEFNGGEADCTEKATLKPKGSG